MDSTQYCHMCQEWKSCDKFDSYEDEWCFSCDEAWSSDSDSESYEEEQPEDTILPELECPKHHCIWKDSIDVHDVAFRSNARFLLHSYCYNDDDL